MLAFCAMELRPDSLRTYVTLESIVPNFSVVKCAGSHYNWVMRYASPSSWVVYFITQLSGARPDDGKVGRLVIDRVSWHVASLVRATPLSAPVDWRTLVSKCQKRTRDFSPYRTVVNDMSVLVALHSLTDAS
jgi:hypothetical protein